MSVSVEPGSPVGLIGVGLLGGAMAERLVGAGFEVVAFDPVAFQVPGVVPVRAAEEVFDRCPHVLLSLPTNLVAAEVTEAALGRIGSGHLVMNTTTGDAPGSITLAARIASRGGEYLEATVAGSSDLMRRGEAVFFLGGDPEGVARVRPILDALTRTAHHLGPVGAASDFKLVHNLVLGLHRAVLAEGLGFAEALGFEPARALDVLRHSPAASAVMMLKGPRMIESAYDPPEARLSQHLKDVRLILERAMEAGVPTPLSEVHRRLLEAAEAAGYGACDNSAVMEAFRKAADQGRRHGDSEASGGNERGDR